MPPRPVTQALHGPKAAGLKIISGGQTGADRAALDFALAHGLPHGGWCPKHRLAEDGSIPAKYRLRETPLPDYAQRTEWNVRDSDATVIFSLQPVLSGGSLATLQFAQALRKPHLHLSRTQAPPAAAAKLTAFLAHNHVRTLNVAGPRASTEPGIGGFVGEVLELALAGPQDGPAACGPQARGWRTKRETGQGPGLS
jgi:hypothetical protein